MTAYRYSATVARRVAELRRAHGWTAQRLADETAATGCRMTRVTVAKIENGHRGQIMVDELYAFATVFGVPVDQLAHDHYVCPTCKDQPPPLFRCLACGSTA